MSNPFLHMILKNRGYLFRMRKNFTLPKLRIESDLKDEIDKAIEKYNRSKDLPKMERPDFIRMAMRKLAGDIIIADEIKLSFLKK